VSLLFGEVELMETQGIAEAEAEAVLVASLRRSGINGNLCVYNSMMYVG